MLVMKFGGTSVEDAKSIDRAATIVKGRLPQKPVVVVSAMAKVTDQLLATARAAGAGNVRILATEILPNLVGPLIVYATLLIPTNILFEASLSYLGLGVPPDEASWGSILSDASGLYDVAWWLMLFPGMFLVITTLAFNLLGDGLRDALDVRADR